MPRAFVMHGREKRRMAEGLLGKLASTDSGATAGVYPSGIVTGFEGTGPADAVAASELRRFALLMDFRPIDPPPLDKGDGNMGRDW
jgi:hypothetical protein